MVRTLCERFLQAAERFADRPALRVQGETQSYRVLRERAKEVAATLVAHRLADCAPLTCVLGERTASSFSALLGALCSGHGYVPMLPTYPPARLSLMIECSEARALIVDGAARRLLEPVLERVPQRMTVLLLDGEVDPETRARFPQHVLLGQSQKAPAQDWKPPRVSDDDIAYLLFTSGSTGQPKGVMVAHRNIGRFLDIVIERYGLSHEDRLSQMFDFTFDLSLFDLFGAWTTGGCVCCPNARERMFPAQYINDSELTVWFSVPSTAMLMKETRALMPNALPGLRLSLFCGEALTIPVAEAWANAAPNSLLENLYGPTELTLACTAYRFGVQTNSEAEGDVVPIGYPLPGMRAKVVNENLQQVAPGETGELVMAGPQVAPGYWRDPERTQTAFVTLDGESDVFYRTGDRVRCPQDHGPLLFLGRLDQQIKIRGYRVELGEIEAAVREEASVAAAVALGWPPAAGGGAHGVIVFIDDASLDPAVLQSRLMARLPRYMVPLEIRVIERLPLSGNLKIDRKALRSILERAADEG